MPTDLCRFTTRRFITLSACRYIQHNNILTHPLRRRVRRYSCYCYYYCVKHFSVRRAQYSRTPPHRFARGMQSIRAYIVHQWSRTRRFAGPEGRERAAIMFYWLAELYDGRNTAFGRVFPKRNPSSAKPRTIGIIFS